MTKLFCNFCGKPFEMEDQMSGGHIFDNATNSEDFDLCADCYDKIITMLERRCAIPPFQNTDADDYDIGEDDSSDYDYDGELNK